MKIGFKKNKTKSEEKAEAPVEAVFSVGASETYASGDAAGDVSRAGRANAKADKKFRISMPHIKRPGKHSAGNSKSRENGEGSQKGFKLPRLALSATKADAGSGDTDFIASVRSSEPILKVTETSKKAVWTKGLLLDLACAGLLVAAAGFFCDIIYEPSLVIWSLPCVAVFMLITTLGSVRPGKARLIAAAVVALILIATAIIWRSTIFGGFAMLTDRFYTEAEQAQAYIYHRFSFAESDSGFAEQAAMAWMTSLAGLIAALPPAGLRRGVCVAITGGVMLAFAYYGLIPSAIFIAVMAVALILAASRGGLLPVIPVMLIVLLLFGAVILIDPGENYAISNMDENFRDRFAWRSALIETGSTEEDLQDEWDSEDYEDWEEETYDEPLFDGEYGTVAAIGIVAILAAAIAAAVYFIHKRLEKRRAENRKGIDSKDPKEAVVAMFPYAVRWLKGLGVEQKDSAFTSMIPAVGTEFSEEYAGRFENMYGIWSEAAYSDHPVSDDSRLMMEGFMKDTIKQTKEKCKLKDKLRIRFRYAL